MLPCTSAMTRSPVAGSSAGAANRGAPELCVHAMLRLTAGTLLLCPCNARGHMHASILIWMIIPCAKHCCVSVLFHMSIRCNLSINMA